MISNNARCGVYLWRKCSTKKRSYQVKFWTFCIFIIGFTADSSKPTKSEITHMLHAHAFNANSFKPHFAKVKKKSNGFDGGRFLIDEKCQYYDALGHMVVNMHKKQLTDLKIVLKQIVFEFSDCFESHVFTAADSRSKSELDWVLELGVYWGKLYDAGKLRARDCMFKGCMFILFDQLPLFRYQLDMTLNLHFPNHIFIKHNLWNADDSRWPDILSRGD